MKQAIQLAALGLVAAGIADAKALKWQREEPSWSPARETAAAMYLASGWSPVPTGAPEPPDLVRLELEKRVRGDDTCGYISGVSSKCL